MEKPTWRLWINKELMPFTGHYYEFRNFKVYWAYKNMPLGKFTNSNGTEIVQIQSSCSGSSQSISNFVKVGSYIDKNGEEITQYKTI